MQTFLPYIDFTETAKCLDNKRLGKQRVEAYQIAKCLLIQETRWKNHPAIKMWKGYETSLIEYIETMMNEWENRGFKNLKMKDNLIQLKSLSKNKDNVIPKWLNQDFCIRHRSNLLRKDKDYYGKYWKNVKDDLDYIWPIN